MGIPRIQGMDRVLGSSNSQLVARYRVFTEFSVELCERMIQCDEMLGMLCGDSKNTGHVLGVGFFE